MKTCTHDVPMNEPCNDQGCCGTTGRLEKLVCHNCEELKKEVARLKELNDFLEEFTCHDCQDTGWLENRVDGRYPCTCFTECEDSPYHVEIARAETAESKLSAVKEQLEAKTVECERVKQGLQSERLTYEDKLEQSEKVLEAARCEEKRKSHKNTLRPVTMSDDDSICVCDVCEAIRNHDN